MGTIPFHAFFTRVSRATPIKTQMKLAEALGVNRSAVTQAKNRDSVPLKWILHLARRYNLSPDWLEFGTNKHVLVARPGAAVEGVAVVEIPLVNAKLSAGGGSFDVDGAVQRTHAISRQLVSRLGSIAAMVFMQVTGDSMEPFIYDGDMVLIDQSQIEFHQQKIYAVGADDTIMIKRLCCQENRVVLLSDNKNYPPLVLEGDELLSFRILGKVVWLCRDCHLE